MNNIYNDDCCRAMEKIPPASINLILTDPPYNLGNFMKNRNTNLSKMRDNFFGSAGWDDMELDQWKKSMDDFFKSSARVIKKGGTMIVFMAVIKVETIIKLAEKHGFSARVIKKGGTMIVFMAVIKVETIIKLAEKHGFYYKTTGIWHKKNPMPRNMNLHFVNSTEAWIYFTYKTRTGTFNNDGAALHDFIETSVTPNRERKHGKHPTQKPESLMQHFVEVLSNPGEWVLDPFAGSGTTCVVCKRVKRRYTGIEINPTYADVANRRIGQKRETQ